MEIETQKEILKGIVLTDKKILRLKNHIALKKFCLKNFDETNNKYKTYKICFVTDFFNKFDSDIKDYLENYLSDYIENKVYEKMSYGFYLSDDLNKDKINKSIINQFKTLINSVTYGLNGKFIKDLSDDNNLNINNNQKRNLTIILYLRNYDLINNIMYNFFEYHLNSILE